MNTSALKLALRAAVSVFLLLSTAATFAQDEPPGNLAETWVVHVDPANGQAFENAIKAHLALRKENEDPFNWSTFVNNTGELGAYYFRACCFSWADLDAYNSWANEHPQVQAHWDGNVHPHVAGYKHHFSEVDFENSHWPEAAADFRFVGVTTWMIKPGGWQEFDAVKGEISQIAINKGWASDEHQWGWSSAVDGAQSMSLSIPFTNYADMTSPDPSFFEFLTEQLGSEEAAANKFAAMNDATEKSSYQIYMRRPDLSTPE